MTEGGAEKIMMIFANPSGLAGMKNQHEARFFTRSAAPLFMELPGAMTDLTLR